MTLTKTLHLVLSIFLLAACAIGDEGMWVFNNLPKQVLKDKYKFDANDEWSQHVMHSSVRFNSGGSGSFVSADGLVITNHHVAGDTLQKLSTAEHNYYHEGYYAKTSAEEAKAPDLEINQLISIEDVTTRVSAAVNPQMSNEEAATARKAVMALIEKESFEATGLRSEVVTLYQGGQYHLYRYKKFTDVRLVFAPEFEIAFFGGDPDNFEYPRYDLDIAIFRVYENNRPVQIADYLRWSPSGSKENDLIFVSGNPGSTNRMFTTAALKYLRDTSIPFTMTLLRRKEILYQQYSLRGAEQARQAGTDLFSVQNSRKVYIGRMKGLQDASLLAAKQRAEYQMRAQVEASADLKKYAKAWDTVDASLAVSAKNLVRYSLLETGNAFNSKLFTIARTLVRMAAEDQKPNEQRLNEFRDSNRASLEQQLYSSAPIYDEYEMFKLADALSFAMEMLGQSEPVVRQMLMGRDPQTRAREIIAGTSLRDVGVRRLLAAGGQSTINQSFDPMIELALIVDEAARQARKISETQVEEPQRDAYGQIAAVRFALFGTSQYPDATFSPRLSFGQVRGWDEGGTLIAPFTTLGGAFQHEANHGAKYPYLLPKPWHDAQSQLNLSTAFNFVSTADIIGGNSGSPVIDTNGEFVGIIFDGNRHSFVGSYVYSDVANRAVSVDSNAILEALRKIYGASALADQLTR